MSERSSVAAAVGNPLFFSFAKHTPGVRVTQYEGVSAQCDVKLNNIVLDALARPNALLPQVVAMMYGNVTALRSNAFPGLAEGEMFEMSFDEPKRVTSDDDTYDVYDSRLAGDVVPQVDMSQPPVVICDEFNLDECYLVSAKGGFVDDYAEQAFSDEIMNGTFNNVPVKLNITQFDIPRSTQMSGDDVEDYDSIYKVDIEDAMFLKQNTKTLGGVSLAKYMNISEVMVDRAELTPDELGIEETAGYDYNQLRREDLDNAMLIEGLEAEEEAIEASREDDALEDEASEIDADETRMEFGPRARSRFDAISAANPETDIAAIQDDQQAMKDLLGGLFSAKKPFEDEDSFEERRERDEEANVLHKNTMIADAMNEGHTVGELAEAQTNAPAATPSEDEIGQDHDLDFFG